MNMFCVPTPTKALQSFLVKPGDPMWSPSNELAPKVRSATESGAEHGTCPAPQRGPNCCTLLRNSSHPGSCPSVLFVCVFSFGALFRVWYAQFKGISFPRNKMGCRRYQAMGCRVSHPQNAALCPCQLVLQWQLVAVRSSAP